MTESRARVNPNMDLHSTTPIPIYRAGRHGELLAVTHEDLCTHLGRRPGVGDTLGRYEVHEYWAHPHVWIIDEAKH